MRNILKILFLLLIISNITYSQKESWNWLFPYSCGITFNTKDTIPKVLNGNMYDWNNAYPFSSVSDKDANLLFYSGAAGEAIGFINFDPCWNKHNEPMLNSYDGTQKLWTNGEFIVPYPGKKNLYYLLKTNLNNGSPYLNDIYFLPVDFDIVDMSKNNGLGEVIYKHYHDYKTPHDFWSLLFAVIKHKNNIDSWLITYCVGNIIKNEEFICYHITNEGIKDTTVNILLNAGNEAAPSKMCISQSGKKIIITNASDFRLINIFNFNNSTGKVTISRSYQLCDSCGISGYELSPDESKLYVLLEEWSNYDSTKDTWGLDKLTIYQFDLNKNSDLDIIKSKTKIGESLINVNDYYYSDMKLAPNGRIYIMRLDTNFLSSIDNPNESGENVKFTEHAVDLGNRKCGALFPTFLNNYYNTYLSTSSNSPVCIGDSLFLNAELSDDTTYKSSYQWQGPNGYSSTNRVSSLPNMSMANSGVYKLTVNVNGAIFVDSINVLVIPAPNPNITGTLETYLFMSEKYKVNNKKGIKTHWSVSGGKFTGGSDVDSVLVLWDSLGFGRLNIEQTNDTSGCTGFDEITVNVLPWPKPDVNGILMVCQGDTVQYKAFSNSNLIYNWQTNLGNIIGPTTDSSVKIIWDNPGIGRIILFQTNEVLGVTDTVIKDVNIIKLPEKPNLILIGDTLLDAGAAGESYNWYLNGELIDSVHGRTFKPDESGKYSVVLIDSNGCRSELSDFYDVILSVNIVSSEIYKFSVYPNPVSNKLIVSTILLNFSFRIFNSLGETFFDYPFSNHITNQTLEVDIKGFPIGVYYCRFQSGNIIETCMFIVIK